MTMPAEHRVQTIARIIADGRSRHIPKPMLTPDLYPDWDEVYEIHDLVHEQLGRDVVGWKVGGADASVRESEGLPDAILGRIYGSGVMVGPAQLGPEHFINFRQCESEIVIELGEGLPDGQNVTAEDVRKATARVYPGLEVGDIVFEDWYGSNPFWGCCLDNAGGAVLVLGNPVPGSAITDLADIDVHLQVNGEPRKTGHAIKAMGDPAVSGAWIINRVRERGFDLPVGSLLSTGTTTGHCFAERGDHVRVTFSELGHVEASFD